MLTETNIRKLTNYILLNAYSANSTGLYNGKAGASLCLFEVSRMLKDNYIEEHAFQLLQESLVSKNEDIGFENGLSGIGFVLNYLIKHKFIDANFDDLFKHNLEKIIDVIENEKNTEDKMIQYLTCLYLFQNLDIPSCHLINKIIVSVYNYLNNKIDEYTLSQAHLSKFNFLKIFRTFLEILTICSNINISSELFQKYSDLYLQNKVASDFSVGHHLKTLLFKWFNSLKIADVANKNMMFASNNIYLDTIMLPMQIKLLFLFHQYGDTYKDEIKKLEASYTKKSNKDLELILVEKIDSRTVVFGYEFGVAKLLLYQVYTESKKSGLDIVRFNHLFN